MINKLHIFSENTYVVPNEWNANFGTLNQSNYDCSISISDAYGAIAFPDSDLTQLFNVVRSIANSFAILGTNVILEPECEYYKTLSNGESLNIQIPKNFNSEARIAIKILDTQTLVPFSATYEGEKLEINTGGATEFSAGVYFILVYETAGKLAMVKLIWTRQE